MLIFLLFCSCRPSRGDARFDLIGPRIDVRVTRGNQTVPIASVPNLQPGDKIWIHPELPESQSVRYLLLCVFLRGNTNPPPTSWFHRINTWERNVRLEGAFVTVPAEAQQALMFLAPATGGDFKTLRAAVRGRPGAFVRSAQDLYNAGLEEERIERYVASIRRVPPSDPTSLLNHSNLLARTLELQPNENCFKEPVDMQFACLTQTGTQVVLDNGQGRTISSVLSGPTADLINQASNAPAAGGGLYSAYVGAIVDVVRIMGNMHTAQYQYIPAISFPQDDAMNLRLNTPPSFENPKSVLVIALPPVEAATLPSLRPPKAEDVTCLIKPRVVIPIEGSPLVFSTDFAHDMRLHFDSPPGAPTEPDIPVTADAYYGGLVLQTDQQHRIPLEDVMESTSGGASAQAQTQKSRSSARTTKPKPVMISGEVKGIWGFDSFTGPKLRLQQLPGSDWTIVPQTHQSVSTQDAKKEPTYDLIAGRTSTLLLDSTGSACVESITAHPDGQAPFPVAFKRAPKPGDLNLLALTLPLNQDLTPGDLHLSIQQYEQPKADEVSARTFSAPATVTAVELHAHDKILVVRGTRLGEIVKVTVGDLVFLPAPDPSHDIQPADKNSPGTLHFSLPDNAPVPSTSVNEALTAEILLRDSRSLTFPFLVLTPRPVVTLLRKTELPEAKDSNIYLSNSNDLPLTSLLTFTLKIQQRFPRNGQVEIETLDGTLRTVLTLAPSGGLLLQDPHTVVATLDPLSSFGPSAFGALRMRTIFPAVSGPANGSREKLQAAATENSSSDDSTIPSSDWIALATLVRLPILTQIQCPPNPKEACTLAGYNLFLLQAVAADPEFTDPIEVPDGYTGTTLSVPRPTAGTIFFKLRDDPSSIDSAVMQQPAPQAVLSPHLSGGTTTVPVGSSGASPDQSVPVVAPPSASPTTQPIPASPGTLTTPGAPKPESQEPASPNGSATGHLR
ncbi:MAG: hypothetical protein ACP5E5_00605 [Acidobacteriaceae bacterium]